MTSTLAVALVTAAAFGSVKTYGAYSATAESDQLLAENVEALSGDGDQSRWLDPCYKNFSEMTDVQCPTETKETTQTEGTSVGATVPIKGKPVEVSVGTKKETVTTETKYSNKSKHICEAWSSLGTCNQLEQVDCEGKAIVHRPC